MKNTIRYSVLSVSFVIGFILIYLNYESPSLLLTQLALILLWVLLPFYVYFLISRKSGIIYSILPAVCLLPVYLFIFIDYLYSDSSTAALGLIFLPLIGFVALGFGCLVAWLFEKLSNRQ